MSAPDRLGLVLSGVLRREGFLDLPASGDSMFPLIRSGDMCRFVGCEPDEIRAGDVVLICAESGRLIAHRVHRLLHEGGAAGAADQCLLLCKGDSNAGFDRPVESAQCIGKLLWIRRGYAAAPLHADHPLAVRWGELLLTLPVISRLLRRWLDWGGRRRRHAA